MRRARVPGLTLLAMATGALLPGAAQASEPYEMLPGTPASAATVDLDGDGGREVVQLLNDESQGMTVEAWTEDEGGWELLGHLDAPVLDHAGRPVRDGEAEIGALVPWTIEGEERLLFVTGAAVDGGPPHGVWTTEVRAGGDGIELVAVGPLISASGMVTEGFQPMDLDADGTDEAVTYRYGYDDPDHPVMEMTILRLGTSGFAPLHRSEHRGGPYPIALVDADGHPGDELLIGPSEDGTVTRLAWRDSEVAVETASLPGEHDLLHAFVVGTLDRHIVLLGEDGPQLHRWERGGQLAPGGQLATGAFSTTFVIGSGPDALLVVASGDSAGTVIPRQARVLDASLRDLGIVTVPPAIVEVMEAVNRPDYGWGWRAPWMGPLPPSGFEGRPAGVYAGVLIQPDGAGGFSSQPFAPLIGRGPLGWAGRDNGWLAVGDGFGAPFSATYLHPGVGLGTGVSLVHRDRLLTERASDEVAAVSLPGAVNVPHPDGGSRLASSGEGFDIVVEAPAGSTVNLVGGTREDVTEVGNEPWQTHLSSRRDENEGFDYLLTVVTPDGWVRAERLMGTFINEPPSVRATARTVTFAGSARVEGSATPGTTVLMDGEPVQATRGGRFDVEVDAGFWPRDLVVVARDALGEEARTVVTVLGFLDYRAWPWVPILGVATVFAGIVLYVRIPHMSRPRRGPVADDGSLEELDTGRIG